MSDAERSVYLAPGSRTPIYHHRPTCFDGDEQALPETEAQAAGLRPCEVCRQQTVVHLACHDCVIEGLFPDAELADAYAEVHEAAHGHSVDTLEVRR